MLLPTVMQALARKPLTFAPYHSRAVNHIAGTSAMENATRPRDRHPIQVLKQSRLSVVCPGITKISKTITSKCIRTKPTVNNKNNDKKTRNNKNDEKTIRAKARTRTTRSWQYRGRCLKVNSVSTHFVTWNINYNICACLHWYNTAATAF